MPKDEFDFDDPMQLNGMALLSGEDTTDAMTECFVEEFMRIGYNHKQVLALFRNPHYIGMNMVLQNRGEDYVKGFITEVFARWGRTVEWGSTRVPRVASGVPPEVSSVRETSPRDAENSTRDACAPQNIELDSTACDPMGAAIPKLNL